jgi:cyanuric acid amidohydrolase
MSAVVHCFDMAGAGDVTALESWLRAQDLARMSRLVVFAKTEGHHAPNDFSRDLLKLKLAQLFASLGLGEERAVSQLTIGCEGVGSAKGFAFARFDDAPSVGGPPRLALGFARSDVAPVAEIGTTALVDRTAATAHAAMRDAGLTPEEVRLLFIKTPLLSARHPEATPNRTVMHRGRAISALGGGVALGEIARDRITEEAIATDLSLYAHRVQAVTGAEITRVEVIAMGNRAGAGGDLTIDSAHTEDILDQASIRRLLRRNGLSIDADGGLLDGERVAALLVKTMVPESSMVRGSRTTVYTSGWAPEAHIRAAASGVLGSLLGHLRFYVSADSVHQAPEGGGLATVVVRAGAAT